MTYKVSTVRFINSTYPLKTLELNVQNFKVAAEFENMDFKRSLTGKLIPSRRGGVRLRFDITFDGNIQNSAWLGIIEEFVRAQNTADTQITLRINGDQSTDTVVYLDASSGYETNYSQQIITHSRPKLTLLSEQLFNAYNPESVDPISYIPKYLSVYN